MTTAGDVAWPSAAAALVATSAADRAVNKVLDKAMEAIQNWWQQHEQQLEHAY